MEDPKIMSSMHVKAVDFARMYLEEVERIADRYNLSDKQTYELALNFIDELFYM